MTLGETIPDERAAAAYDHIEDDIYYRQLRDTLDNLIATMPQRERETIEGVYYEGKTIARLAREQGKPYCTVRERRQSALRKLRRQSHILRHYIAYDVPDVAYRGGLGAFREHWASATERAVIKIMQVNTPCN